MRATRAATSAVAIGVAVSSGVLVAGVAGAATVPADTTTTRTVAATDDAYVSSKRPGTNFGAAGRLVVGTAGGDSRTAYVKFLVSALPAGAVVTGARLSLPVEGAPAAARLTAYPVTGAWTESAITGAVRPAVGATPVGSVLAKATDTALSIDLTATVTRPGTYSFALRSAASAPTNLRSAETGAVSGGPQLSLTYRLAAPSKAPTSAPTKAPTTAPTKAPTTAPTASPTSAPTKAPTTAPTVSPTTAPPTTAPAGCVTGALLVPSCGVLWGAAAGGFTSTPRDQALQDWEKLSGRTATIFHTYHKGDEKFPTASEIAMTRDPAAPRVLLLNWKVAYGSTWAKVAAGEKDARIDAWAKYVKATYGTQRFFLALHHEPENDVMPAAGSGMTAKDYAAMYRHVILRLRAAGVSNMVNVLAYMGNEKWMAQSWWKDIYPGDDVVDWIGLDSYVSVEKGYYHFGGFDDLLDREPTGGGLGFYDWSATNHPSKPIMVAEWGMYHRSKMVVSKASAFDTVLPELAKRPLVKAIVYFDTAKDDEGDRNIAINSTVDSLAAFRKVAASKLFDVKLTN